MFSKRISYNIEENRISKLLNEKKSNGEILFDLTESNPTNAGFDYDFDNIKISIAKSESDNYSPDPKGLLTAREAISNYYAERDIIVEPDNIFLTSGTSEAYSFIFKLLANPFDEILIPRPGYPLFCYIAEMESVNTEFYDLTYTENNSWRINLDSIKSQITNKTKAIILINPNNPTGHFIKKNELDELIDICKKNNLPIICDEVFLDYSINGDKGKIITLAGADEVLTFTLSGISKICGLPQMKLSWIVINGNKDLRDEGKARLEIITDTYLSVGTPIQLGLQEILKNKKHIQKQIINRIKRNYELLKTYSKDINNVKILNTEGGWYSVINIYKKTDEELITYELLKEKNVYIHPGYFYDFEYGCHIVVSLLTREVVFKEGIKRIIDYLSDY